MANVTQTLRDRGGDFFAERLRRQMPGLAPQLMQYGSYWPHAHLADGYARSSNGTAPVTDGFAIPPRELWASYCTSPESFVQSGREDVETMTRLLADAGVSLAQAERVLELGCAAGRMLRHLPAVAPGAELWGTDLWATAVMWCQDHMSPPCNFATTTMAPHLPFENRSFDLVYCGSVFTHIDDLADAWFLELHRILRPGGRLYFSVNDRHSAGLLLSGDELPRYWERTGGRAGWDSFAQLLREREDFQRFMQGEAYMFTMGRSMVAHVMWDPQVLCRRLAYGWQTDSVTPEAYGHQTVVLLERKG